MQMEFTKITGFVKNLDTQNLLANLAMVITVILWGISFISIKVAVLEVPPITMALIRFIIASFILLILVKKLEPTARLEKEDLLRMATAGFLGVTLYFYFENTGVKLTTASNASIIASIIPIIATTMDFFIFKTRISIIQFFGMIIAIIGTYLAITANGQVNFFSITFKGNLLIVGAMVSWTLYTLYNKTLINKYSGLFLTTYQNLFGTLLLIPASLTEYSQWRLFSLKAFCNIFFLAVCCSAICYFLYIYALRKLDVAVTTIYLNLVPIVGVIGGHLLLRETILPIQLFGGAVIIIGIFIVNLKKISGLIALRDRC